MLDVPFLAEGLDDAGQVARRLLRLALGPEVAQRIHADDGNAALLQGAGHLLVDIAPAAVARIDHGHRIEGRRRLEDGERQTERAIGIAGRVDMVGERLGQDIRRRVRLVPHIDIGMRLLQRRDVIPPGLGRLVGEEHGHRRRQRAIGETVDGTSIDLRLGGGRAENLVERNAGLRIHRDSLADRRGGALGDHRQRQRTAFADAGDDGRIVARRPAGPLDLMGKRLHVGDHIDAIPVIGLQGLEIGWEIDADDCRALFDEGTRLLVFIRAPAVRIRDQKDAGARRVVRQENMIGGDHAGRKTLVGLLREADEGRGTGKEGGKRERAKNLHLEITPLTPPPMRKVTSIRASAAPVAFETAR